MTAEPARIVVGTAGHVDHGKTALVRALTGIDTDRLPEERRRGISIDLGFAHLDLPGGRRVAFVDVPGHERFIKNMVAGVHGVDACLLVVAADEGVMPQTREHLDILRLLGVDRGLVALTKRDLVDDDWLDLVQEDVRRALAGSHLAEVPILAVSSLTGEGLDQLRAALSELFAAARPRSASGPARLPIDRSFTVPGFGTVVTGTLVSGTVRVGDRLEILPLGREVRVRGLQSHGQAQEDAAAGQRVAVNIAGADWREVGRGMTLATPGRFRAERLIAARVTVGDGAPALVDGARVRLHAGTQETPARIVLLEAGGEGGPAVIAPGTSAFVRIHAARPVVVAAGDRFLIRALTPVTTVGGGIVLDAGRRYRKRSPADLARLAALESGRPADLLREALAADPVVLARWAADNGWTEADVRAAVAEWVAAGEALWLLDGEAAVAAERWRRLLEDAAAGAADYLRAHPLRRGWPREEARLRLLPSVEPQTGQRLLEAIIEGGALERTGDAVRPPAGREPEVPAAVVAAVDEARRMYEEARLQPPDVQAVAARTEPAVPAAEVIRHLVERGELVHAGGDVYFARSAVEAAMDALRRGLAGGRAATLAEIRDMLGTTRKYAVPLAEYLDRVRFTRREGDLRRLMSRHDPEGARGTRDAE